MERITKQSLIDNVAKRFRSQYYDNGWNNYTTFKSGLNAEQAYIKLLDAKTQNDVLEIVGNITWVENKCHECGLDSDVVIIIGEIPDYESNTAQVCPKCLKKALDLTNGY